MVLDDVTRTALERVRAPVQLLRAERGLFDADPLIPVDTLHMFAAAHPSVRVEEVADANHYTLVMGHRLGPRWVAAAIDAACAACPCGSGDRQAQGQLRGGATTQHDPGAR